MAPLSIRIPNGDAILEAKPITPEDFNQFGTLIENPSPSLVPSPSIQQLPPNAVLANQGSAIKHIDVTNMVDLYDHVPSKIPGKAVMNMFVCAPRALSPSDNESFRGFFPVEILERHPFTTQTFIPLGISPKEMSDASYLVIVAPSLPPSPSDAQLPVPSQSTSTLSLPGRGLPDLKRLRAFVCKGSQAVTYGAGTWHAPMVVIGSKKIDFVVVQFANGVGNEDCQEVEFKEQQSGEGIKVAIPRELRQPGLWSKL